MMPFTLGMAGMAIGGYQLWRHRYKKAKYWIAASFLWLAVFSYPPTAKLLLAPLEHRYETLEKPPQVAYIYLLGSEHFSDPNLPITSQLTPEAVVRMSEAVRLYRQIPNATVIVSGYEGLHDKVSHARMQHRFAVAMGIPVHKIVLVEDAADTEEEAYAAKRITRGKSTILVTSAYHMPRAMRWFREAGLTPLPAPTYHLTHVSTPLWICFSPEALRESAIAMHEYLGIVWQRLKLFLRHTDIA